MKGKLIAGALAGATLATGAITPTLSNATNANKNVPKTNDVLLAKPVANVSGQEAVVINGNNNLVLFSQANGTSINSYLSTGQMLTLMNKDGNFYQVKVQETGAVGYISTSNMQIIQSGVNSPFVQKISDGSIINVSTAVHLRAQPDMQAGVLKNLKEGTNLEILGTQGQWVKVNVGGTIGYVYETYVSNGTTNSATTNSQNTTGQTITSNKVNSTTSTTNSSGTTATKPNTNNSNVKPGSGATSSVNPTYLNDTAYLKAGKDVTLYANTPTSMEAQAKVLKTFNNEKINVTVLSFNNGMYKVKLSDGSTGYIAPEPVVFSGQGAKSEYLNKLNDLTLETINIMQSKEANVSQNSMNMYSGKTTQMWNNQLNDMYNSLLKTLPQAQANQLKTSHANFETARDNAVDSAIQPYKGGSIVPLIANGAYRNATQQRCLELVNQYPELYTAVSTNNTTNKTVNNNTDKTVTNNTNNTTATSNTTTSSNTSNTTTNTATSNTNNTSSSISNNSTSGKATTSKNQVVTTRTKSTSDKTKSDSMKTQNQKTSTSTSSNSISNTSTNTTNTNTTNKTNNAASSYLQIEQIANSHAVNSSTLAQMIYTHIFDYVAPCKGYIPYNQISGILNNGTTAQKQQLLKEYGDNCLVVNLGLPSGAGAQNITPSTFSNGHYFFNYGVTNLYSLVNNPNAGFKFQGVIEGNGTTPSVSAYNKAISNHQVYALGLGQLAYSAESINC